MKQGEVVRSVLLLLRGLCCKWVITAVLAFKSNNWDSIRLEGTNYNKNSWSRVWMFVNWAMEFFLSFFFLSSFFTMIFTSSSSNTLTPDVNSWFIGKDPDAGKDWRQKEKRIVGDEMVGWHHHFNRHELGCTLGDGEGQGSLACCTPRGHKESDVA